MSRRSWFVAVASALVAAGWILARPRVIRVEPQVGRPDPLLTLSDAEEIRRQRATHLSPDVGATVRGKVVEEGSGAAVVGAVVEVVTAIDAGPEGQRACTSTGGDGEFRLVAPPDETIDLVVVWQGCALVEGESDVAALWLISGGGAAGSLRTPGAGQTVERNVRVVRPRRLRGLVTDASGAPVQGAAISWRPGTPEDAIRQAAGAVFVLDRQSWTTDDEGGFDVAIPPSVSCVLAVAEARGWALSWSGAVHFARGEFPDASIELRRAGAIAGRVTGPSGEPAAGVDVWWFERGRPFEDRPPVATTANDGSFVLDDVAPGRVTVMASRPRDAKTMPDERPDVLVEPARTTRIDIVLTDRPVFAPK